MVDDRRGDAQAYMVLSIRLGSVSGIAEVFAIALILCRLLATELGKPMLINDDETDTEPTYLLLDLWIG